MSGLVIEITFRLRALEGGVEITKVVERVGIHHCVGTTALGCPSERSSYPEAQIKTPAGLCPADSRGRLSPHRLSPHKRRNVGVVNLYTRLYNHRSMTVTVRSFAKINLGLYIGAARDDGFHELLTVYQTIALHDVIQVSVGSGDGIEIRCADPRVPKDESNTCFRIAKKAMLSVARNGARRHRDRQAIASPGWHGWRIVQRCCNLARIGEGAKEVSAGSRKIATCRGGWLGLAAVSGGRCGSGCWAGRAGLSTGGFAGDSLCGIDPRSGSVDAQGVCGMGSLVWSQLVWRGHSCPRGFNQAGLRSRASRAALGRTAGGGCPHTSKPKTRKPYTRKANSPRGEIDGFQPVR